MRLAAVAKKPPARPENILDSVFLFLICLLINIKNSLHLWSSKHVSWSRINSHCIQVINSYLIKWPFSICRATAALQYSLFGSNKNMPGLIASQLQPSK
jgi:hypothetical protein